jgi:hypothetical protein
MRRILIILVALFAAALPAGALADDGKDNGGLLLRLNGDYTVPTGQELNALVVVHGDVVVDGLVHSSVTVIDGDVRINGTVEGDLQVWRGDVTLSATSVVKNVELVRGDLVRDPGATVTGDVSESSGVFLRAGWLFFFGLLFFIGLGVAMMVVSTGFALVAGKQLGEAAVSLTAKPWQTIVSGIITVLALPVAAVVAIATIVGFWVGLGIFLVLMPVLGVLGLAVSATWIGLAVLQQQQTTPQRPVAAAALGTMILLVLLIIPGLNVLTLLVFGTWGVGALAFMAVRGLGHGRGTPTPAPAPGPAAPLPTA